MNEAEGFGAGDALATQPMEKPFAIESIGGYPVFRVTGDVDFSNQPDFDAALRGLDPGAATAVIVSFEECTFFDSSIVGVLMKYWRWPERAWDAVLVTKSENPANRVFDIVGIDQVYPVEHSLGRAVERAMEIAAARERRPASSG